MYTLSTTATATGSVVIKTFEDNPAPTTYFYGGGIRIRHIGYFDGDAGPDYYTKTAYYNDLGIYPVKQKNYAYNCFDKPGFSSGVAVDIYSEPVYYRQMGSDQVCYRNVTVTDTPDNGREEFTYSTHLDFSTMIDGVTTHDDFRRGLLTNKKAYDASNTLLANTDFQYGTYDVVFFDNHNALLNVTFGWAGLTGKTTSTYYAGASNPYVQTDNYTYNNGNRQIATMSATNELGEVLKTEYTYHTGDSPFSSNRISEPEEIKSYLDDELTASTKIVYANAWSGNESYLPASIAAAKGSNNQNIKIRNNAYDPYSHLLETQPENGIKTSYIWGYNNTVAVAKIQNMAYADIPSTLINDIQAATDIANNENNILIKLDALRNHAALAGAMITTYTYKPLVGVSTITGPIGNRIRYEYDNSGHLMAVRDSNNKILSETEYHIQIP
jgi:YD repeat-containing protein